MVTNMIQKVIFLLFSIIYPPCCPKPWGLQSLNPLLPVDEWIASFIQWIGLNGRHVDPKPELGSAASIFYRWITAFIQWREGGSQEPDSVLRRGAAEDEGFAALFAAMAAAVGVQATKVGGFASLFNSPLLFRFHLKDVSWRAQPPTRPPGGTAPTRPPGRTAPTRPPEGQVWGRSSTPLFKHILQVSGYLKDVSYIPGEEVATLSTWNMVNVGAASYIVDCCRGAGVIRNGTFEPL